MLSVIIPFYNETTSIGLAVNSVLKNCVGNCDYEIIICNDGALTESEIRSSISCGNDSALKIIKNTEPQGPGGARNCALNVASGDYIAFLDADDYWLDGKISKQMRCILDGFTFVATGYGYIGYATYISPPTKVDCPLDIFLKRGIGTSTVMVARKLLGNQRFKTLRFSQDIDFWYALSQLEDFRYHSIDVECVKYSKSGSTKNKWIQLKSLSHVLKLNNIPYLDRIRVILSYAFNGVINHWIKGR